MERVDRRTVGRAQANMHAAVVGDAAHVAAPVDPEFRIFLAIADGRIRPFAQFRHAERRQERGVERLRLFQIAHGDGDVVDHGDLFHLSPLRGERSSKRSERG
jgi:hypothetical protein